MSGTAGEPPVNDEGRSGATTRTRPRPSPLPRPSDPDATRNVADSSDSDVLTLVDVGISTRIRKFVLAPPTLLTVVMTVLAVLVNRDRLGLHLAGGRLLPIEGLIETWSLYLASWHPVGGGSAAPPPAALAVIGLLGLTVVIAGMMYAGGESAAAVVRRFGFKLGGQRGEDAVILAGKAIRGVALGVGVTAFVQAVIGGIGLAIAGVPFAALLTAVMFMLCIVQVGPTLVLAPAVIWVFWSGSTGWGIFLLVWTIIVGTMDNFLRPLLIRRGADLPLVLIFAGVIGGLLGFGLVGIFVGPVMLAVSYTLVDAWLRDAEPLAAPEVTSSTDSLPGRPLA